jgi:hypothetical protein
MVGGWGRGSKKRVGGSELHSSGLLPDSTPLCSKSVTMILDDMHDSNIHTNDPYCKRLFRVIE